MKILMLTSYMNMGGAETHIAELCRGLGRTGHTVEVASSGGRFADILESEGFPHHTLPFHRKNPLSVLQCCIALKRLVNQGDFDLVHVHSRIPALVCSISGIPFVTTAHLDFKVNPILRRIAKWGNFTAAVSCDIKSYLIREYGVPEDNISVTVNGIDTDRFSPSKAYRDEIRNEFGISEGDRLMVYLSRLDRDRNLPAKLLCKIMPKLLREYPDTRLLIVGDGDGMTEVEALAKDSVILAGTRYDTEKIISAADIFCGVSRSALEAMAVGIPVILSGNQGHMGIFTEDMLPSAADTNFCCRGFPEPTEELLFRDVRTLLSLDTEELKAMGVANRAVVIRDYSVNRMVGDCIRMYEKMIRTTPLGQPDAVISGYFGYGNSGDDTALDCLVAAIRLEKPDAKVAVLCRDPENFGRMHDIIGIGRYSIISAIRAIKQSGLLISGGGSLLQNVTSTRSLRYYAAVIGVAKLCGARVFICANGIGPIKGKTGLRIAYNAVMKADRISVRDSTSRKTLTEMGIPEDSVELTADPAFRLSLGEKCDISDIKNRIGIRKGTKYFAVSVRSSTVRDGKFREVCRSCRDIFLTYGYIPIFISMQESEDLELCRRLANETCGEAVAIPPMPPRELYSLISETELVISMRLHLIIYAAAAGIPSVGISVDPKLDAVTKLLPSAALVDGDGFTCEKCTDAVKGILYTDRNKLLKTARELALRSTGDAVTAVSLMRDESGSGSADGRDAAPGSVF